ncbi:DUF6333 family protein [Streptomyces sp. NPDC048483]|uniref:DUF6333 family protein n=1 Tax=Streptomyces sp. NPDC048483 TaxID=3154927 RepID=UPI00343A62FA
MTDQSFWTMPASETVRGSMVHGNLTVLQPPFIVDTTGFPSHDPALAAAFCASLSSVDAVLEDLGPRSAANPPVFSTAADLDIVHAGAWGNALAVSDPAFVSDGNDTPLLDEATALRERFPDARIVGRVEVHCGATHTEDLVWLPDGTMFHAAGWPGDEPFVVSGDPAAVLAALGMTQKDLDNNDDLDAFIDLDDDPNHIEWGVFAGLALGAADPWGVPGLNLSALRVRHTESATADMEGLYFIGR